MPSIVVAPVADVPPVVAPSPVIIQPPPVPQADATFTIPKLHALTSLRFFAAAMIVLLHAQGYFGTIAPLARFTLTQGVCFFFVLSGFILTYAYPSLDVCGGWRFLVARLARIVPLHVVAFILYLLLLPAWYRDSVSRGTRGAGLLTLFLLQAWVPVNRVQTAFNGVSWSLSVEFFFYLCFPLLLWRWRRTWHVKLAASFLLVCGSILVANDWLPHLPRGAAVPDVVYFFPPARLWEFVVGVATAHLWRYLRPRVHCGRWAGTALEVAILAATFAVMYQSGTWAHRAGRLGMIGPGGEAWLASSGFVCLPFAALICVMACEWGWVARLLSRRPLVLLGEMSFSLYLLHLIVCHYYVMHPGPFVTLPPWLLYLGYGAIVLLTAYVGWAVVEGPCRRAIVGFWGRHTARDAAVRRVARHASARSVRQWNIVAAGTLVLIVAGVRVATGMATPAVMPSANDVSTQGRALVAIDLIGQHPATADTLMIVDRHDYPSGAMAVVGWSADPAGGGSVRGVLVGVDGQPATWADYGSGRNDVAAHLGGARYLHSGFIGMVSVKDLSDGPHTITVQALGQSDDTITEMQQVVVIR
ncbi:MAG: acyltransferase [Chloroflexota bacterium]|nr:acyltransferase [Chloroflexota bacterium]